MGDDGRFVIVTFGNPGIGDLRKKKLLVRIEKVAELPTSYPPGWGQGQNWSRWEGEAEESKPRLYQVRVSGSGTRHLYSSFFPKNVYTRIHTYPHE